MAGNGIEIGFMGVIGVLLCMKLVGDIKKVILPGEIEFHFWKPKKRKKK